MDDCGAKVHGTEDCQSHGTSLKTKSVRASVKYKISKEQQLL